MKIRLLKMLRRQAYDWYGCWYNPKDRKYYVGERYRLRRIKKTIRHRHRPFCAERCPCFEHEYQAMECLDRWRRSYITGYVERRRAEASMKAEVRKARVVNKYLWRK